MGFKTFFSKAAHKSSVIALYGKTKTSLFFFQSKQDLKKVVVTEI